jgi:hypothetical protein
VGEAVGSVFPVVAEEDFAFPVAAVAVSAPAGDFRPTILDETFFSMIQQMIIGGI